MYGKLTCALALTGRVHFKICASKQGKRFFAGTEIRYAKEVRRIDLSFDEAEKLINS